MLYSRGYSMDSQGVSTRMAEMKYYQTNSDGNGPVPSQAYAMSLLGNAFGDGEKAEFGLFIVAHSDHGDAEHATLVVRHLMNEIVHGLYHPFLTNNAPSDISTLLSVAVNSADGELRKQYANSAVALTAAVVVNKHLYLAHVGNSRAYLATPGYLEQLTQDYALPSVGGDNVWALGYGDALGSIDVIERQLPANSGLLLENQGYWSNDEIASTITEQGSPYQVCKQLIETAQAREAGNIALIFVQVPAY